MPYVIPFDDYVFVQQLLIPWRNLVQDSIRCIFSS